MKKIFIANWKMNLDYPKTLNLASKISTLSSKKFHLVIAPSFPMLDAVRRSSSLEIAAQNCAAWDAGSYTGEVMARTLKQIGCKYVIIGHSERRHYLFENDDLINKKISQAVKVGLIPVLCFGETAQETDNREQIIVSQIKNDLQKIKFKENNELFLAYEPVWAIGTGKSCPVKTVIEVYRIARRLIVNFFGNDFFESKVKFLYGGSVDKKNINEYYKAKEVDGFLVGKTSLDIEQMKEIFRQ